MPAALVLITISTDTFCRSRTNLYLKVPNDFFRLSVSATMCFCYTYSLISCSLEMKLLEDAA